VALRTRDKVFQTQDELLKCIKNLNPGRHTEQWRVFYKQSEPRGQRLTLLIKRTGYKLLIGLSQGTVKALKYPEAQHQNEEGVVVDTASSKSISEGEGNDIPTSSDDLRGAVETKEEIPSSTKFTCADQGTPSYETWSDKKERAEEEEIRTDPPLEKRGRKHKHTQT
jgi:cytoskeletal protein RodZ